MSSGLSSGLSLSPDWAQAEAWLKFWFELGVGLVSGLGLDASFSMSSDLSSGSSSLSGLGLIRAQAWDKVVV